MNEIEQRDLNKGILPNVLDRKREREKWINASNPAARALRRFENRQNIALGKRRAETRLMRLQERESTMLLERDDPSARIVYELVANVAHAVSECAAVDVSVVTNESNNFYSNFCLFSCICTSEINKYKHSKNIVKT